MKKKWYGRVAGLCLILSLTLGLCACGNGNKMVNAALAKEFVYRIQGISLPEIEGDDYNILTYARWDGSICLLTEVYHWSETAVNKDFKLITVKEDGSDVQIRSLEIPSEEGSGSGGGTVVRPMPRTMDISVNQVVPKTEQTEDIWEYSNYNSFLISGDGKIYGIRDCQYENQSDPENPVSRREYFLNCWSMDGSRLWEKSLGAFDARGEEYFWIRTMVMAEDGNLYMILESDNIYKVKADTEGNVSDRTPVSEDTGKLLQNFDRLLTREDGTSLIIYYDENDWTQQYIATFDIVTETLGEPAKLPSSLGWNGYHTLDAGKNSDLLYSNSIGIFTYDLGDTESVQKMNFINSDLNIQNLICLMDLDENSYFAIYYEDYENGMKAGKFTYVDPKEIQDKAVLVLAGNYIGSDLKQRIVEYNRASEAYRIVIKEYDTYNNYEDYEAGYKQLNNDIITGNMPDILLTDGLPMENYAAKGLLADIGKLMEQDEELSQVEFVQNVLDAYSVDGKLYYVIPSFNVRTMVAKTSLVGDKTGWTMEEANALLATMPEGTNLIGELTRDGFFGTMMNFCGGDFVDVSTGKCDFNSPYFISMMEYANNLPVELNEESYGEDYWMTYQSQYRDNKTILCTLNINSISNLNYTINGRIGEDITYIGFPTESGQGSYVNAYDTYAISSRSANIDGAWEFLRYYLSEEYQSELEWGMPIQMKYFRENAQKALNKPFYLDENGEKVEYDDYYYINDERIPLPLLNQEQIDKAVNFITSINKCYYGNNDLMTIIDEEMQSFYTGQKSAQEVAAIIQSRAQIYVDENR